MRFDIVTIFPEFFTGPLDHGILRRAREAGLVDIHIQDLRVFTKDRHKTVDDRPFGGGEGMVLKPEPLFEAVESLLGQPLGDATRPTPLPPNTAIVLLSAAGKLFHQETARRYAALDRIILLCGRYEGVDERVTQHLATEEISIGDFVLSGGELPATLIIDAVTRLLPGALGNEASTQNESFSSFVSPDAHAPDDSSTSHRPPVTGHWLLDFPHFTRPAEFRGWKVPEVLIGGNHAEVAKWRRYQSLEKTLRNRPDLLDEEGISSRDRAFLRHLRRTRPAKIESFFGPYRFLSNFYPVTVHRDGVAYPSVENAYQSAKTDDPALLEMLRTCAAGRAKHIAATLPSPPDWAERKQAIMFALVREKFFQEPLRTMLLETGDAELIEGNGWGDTYWGVCDGEGQNHLGKILMQIRAELREAASQAPVEHNL